MACSPISVLYCVFSFLQTETNVVVQRAKHAMSFLRAGCAQDFKKYTVYHKLENVGWLRVAVDKVCSKFVMGELALQTWPSWTIILAYGSILNRCLLLLPWNPISEPDVLIDSEINLRNGLEGSALNALPRIILWPG